MTWHRLASQIIILMQISFGVTLLVYLAGLYLYESGRLTRWTRWLR